MTVTSQNLTQIQSKTDPILKLRSKKSFNVQINSQNTNLRCSFIQITRSTDLTNGIDETVQLVGIKLKYNNYD